MKIIYILSGTTVFGGATKAFRNILNHVLSKGHEALVVCPDKNGIYAELEKENLPGVELRHLSYTYDILPFLKKPIDYPMFLPRLIKRWYKNRRSARQLINICREYNPDIIHTNTSVNNIGYLAAKQLGIPHIWHIREYGDRDFGMIVPDQQVKLNYPGNYSIVITKDIQRYKSQNHNTRSRVIYDGMLDETQFQYLPKDNRYFLYAGRITRNKGALDLIESYIQYVKNTSGPHLPLYMAGKPDEDIKREIISICENHNLDKKVILLGERHDIFQLMAASTAVIVPSLNEGFGFVLPESMAAGALTIGRNTGGTKEQYDNGLEFAKREIGIRFSDNKELATILAAVAKTDKESYREMIESSQKVVRSLYTRHESGEQIIKFYKDILTSK